MSRTWTRNRHPLTKKKKKTIFLFFAMNPGKIIKCGLCLVMMPMMPTMPMMMIKAAHSIHRLSGSSHIINHNEARILWSIHSSI